MEIKSLLIAGVVPAVLLGTGTVLMKLSMREGANIASYLAVVGATVCCVGTVAVICGFGWQGNIRSSMAAVGMGLAWATAIGTMAYGVSTLRIPVAVIAPLTNANCLVALLLAALLFKEWRDIDLFRATAGALLVVAGATVVSWS